MCAGVCPFIPESRTGAGRETVSARMTKRRAGSPEPVCSEPEKKRSRSVCSSEDTPLASPPPVLECTALPDSVLHCRKRPGSPEPLGSILPEPKKATATRGSSLRTTAADSSGKFAEESRVKPRMQRPGEGELRLGKAAALQSNNDDRSEDQLCAFNTFQFWRTPLPEVDFSLLDPQISEDAATKDSTEAMET